MDFTSARTKVRELCIEVLGERLGEEMAALVKPGFVLKPAGQGEVATGRCQAGGSAFLEPGTPWPQSPGGAPLSLAAVLDTDELAPWLGDDLPTRLGLVNVFRGDGGDCQVVLADPAGAVEVPVPSSARGCDPVRLRAAPIITLPSVSGEYDTGDPVLETFDYHAEPDYDEDDWESPVERFVQGPLRQEWHFYCQDEQGFTPGETQAFGWPHIDSWVGKRAEGYSHLLTISGDLWDDNGFERVMVASNALQTGKLASVVCEQDGLH